MGRPREHDEVTRRALLEAAERIVDRGGPAALSVRAVAEAVGTTTRAVYSLFGSKDGLLEALAIRLFEQLQAALDRIPTTDDPMEDLVTASVEGFRRVALEHPSLYSLVFLRVVPDLELGPAFREIASATFGRLEAGVARIGDTAPFGDHRPIDVARAVHALTEGLASLELRGALASDHAESIWRDAVRAVVRGFDSEPRLTPGSGSPPRGRRRANPR
jgi:AcrR family transcriptional regulator